MFVNWALESISARYHHYFKNGDMTLYVHAGSLSNTNKLVLLINDLLGLQGKPAGPICTLFYIWVQKLLSDDDMTVILMKNNDGIGLNGDETTVKTLPG